MARPLLVAPDLLNNLAASFLLEARRNPKGLGALDEGRLLKGEYPFRELNGLGERDRQTLLDAATTLFLEHHLCFRETHGSETLLIFPELINLKMPRIDEPFELEDDVSYTVSGDVENAYAALVVLLGYTNLFTRTNQWRTRPGTSWGSTKSAASDVRGPELRARSSLSSTMPRASGRGCEPPSRGTSKCS